MTSPHSSCIQKSRFRLFFCARRIFVEDWLFFAKVCKLFGFRTIFANLLKRYCKYFANMLCYKMEKAGVIFAAAKGLSVSGKGWAVAHFESGRLPIPRVGGCASREWAVAHFERGRLLIPRVGGCSFRAWAVAHPESGRLPIPRVGGCPSRRSGTAWVLCFVACVPEAQFIIRKVNWI